MQFTEHPTKHPATSLLAGLAIAGTIAVIAARSGGVPAGHEVDWLNQLAVSGNTGAQLQLGLAYRDGRYGLKPAPSTALYWLRAAAKGGNAYAADTVANHYASNAQADLQQALPWWQLAARGGNADAQVHLGEFMLTTGHDQRAITWLRDAADRGDGRAHDDLVSLYRDDPLPSSDLHRGENPVAAIGERADSTGLKTLYAIWRTVKASSPTTQSSDALIERAKHGDPVAEYQLAERYRDGAWAVERDPRKAITWLRRSAEAGNRVAAKTLAEIQHSDSTDLGTTPGAASGGSRT
jgi:TPR repeat protein